jgi:retron-type reverse transcriptase
VIQQAIAGVTAQYDGEFSEHSHGFPRGRNAHQAVRRVAEVWAWGPASGCRLRPRVAAVDHELPLARLREDRERIPLA